MNEQTWPLLTGESQDIWNQNAAFWDEHMGEGNAFQRVLIGPVEERLLELQGGECILDVACGNGNFARRLAALGAQVVACDFSQVFIERARSRPGEGATQVEYRVVDATRRDQLLALGEARFDAAVCNMALMDMSEIDPLLQTLPRLLKPGGRFIFAVQHPCFNSSYMTRLVEEEDRAGTLITRYAVKMAGYATPLASKGLGIIGQPAPHYYFHRPLNALLNACFDAGFLLDRFEEPLFGEETQPNRPFSWANYREFPPVIVARVRLLPQACEH